MFKTLALGAGLAVALVPAMSSSLHAADFDLVSPRAITPVVEDRGVLTFELRDGDCISPANTACDKAFQRMEFVSRDAHRHGDRVRYRWEVFVPEDFAYESPAGHLKAGRLFHEDGSTIYFLLDPKNGYDIDRATCFGPDAFGTWHTIEISVLFDSTRKRSIKDRTPGEIHVTCDGVEVLKREGRPNIPEGAAVHLGIGLHGGRNLGDADNVRVQYRNVAIEAW